MVPSLSAVQEQLAKLLTSEYDFLNSLILFGSVAYGTPDEHSDVDLLAVYDIENNDYDDKMWDLEVALYHGGLDASITSRSLKELSEIKPSPLWSDILHKGILIKGAPLIQFISVEVPLYSPEQARALRIAQYTQRAHDAATSASLLTSFSSRSSRLSLIHTAAVNALGAIAVANDTKISFTRTEPGLTILRPHLAAVVNSFEEINEAYSKYECTAYAPLPKRMEILTSHLNSLLDQLKDLT